MSEVTKSIYLQGHPLFAHLNSQKIETISTLMKVKTYSRGELFGYGEGCYSRICLLIKGQIKISENDEAGNEQVKDILTAPDIFGDLSLDGVPSPYEYAVDIRCGEDILYLFIAGFVILTDLYLAFDQQAD